MKENRDPKPATWAAEAAPGHESGLARGWRMLFENLCLFLVLVAANLATRHFIVLKPTDLNPIWVPSGIALAALLTRPGWSGVPAIWISIWIGDVLVREHPWMPRDPYEYLVCTANALQPVIGCLFWRRWIRTPPFGDWVSFLKFTLLAAVLPVLITRGIIIGIIKSLGLLGPGRDMARFFMRAGIIAISHILGVFLTVPLILAPWRFGSGPGRPRMAALLALNILLTLAVCWASFNWMPSAIYLVIPLILMAAICCGVRGTALSVLIVTVYGMAGTARCSGPFVYTSSTDLGAIFEMGAFALCLAVPGLFTAITLDQLRNHRRDLEAAVAARTAELERAKGRAEAADAAKSEFLASMAHEVRTPMNGVIGYARLLESSKLDADQRDSVQSIVSSGEMLLTLVNELLDLSRIEAGAVLFERKEVELRRIAPEVVRLLSIEARDKGLKLECTVDDGVPERLVGDPTRIKQVLLNLVSNAVKFTERGGVSVRVTSKAQPAQPGQPARHCITLSVADTGIGISEEQMKRIFTSFGQADASIGKRFGGSGLGLVISRRLCELMNGSLDGSSEPNRGSVFTARLVIDA